MIENIIKRPLVTEKTSLAREALNRYAFAVSIKATKHQIKKAVQDIFNVKVSSVHTMIVHGKRKRFGRSVGRVPNWKKAVVTLEKGGKIELMEAK